MTETKRNGGRPSLYKAEYCEAVIEDARKGFSLSAFAGSIPVDRDTITEWRKVHPEFDIACRAAKAVRARYLETGILKEDIAGPAMNARRFALINCAEQDWRAEATVKHVGGGKDDEPIRHEHQLDFSALTTEELEVISKIGIKEG